MGLLKANRDNGADQLIQQLTSKAAKNTPWEADWGEDSVNCYAWAANCERPHKGKPDPGSYSGIIAKLDRNKLIEGAKMDGMAYAANASPENPPDVFKGFYCVALYLSSHDHHWYRRDSKTGFWTHKPGANGVRNYGPGFTILPKTLHTANHDYGSLTNYHFVAYFYVPEEGIQV